MAYVVRFPALFARGLEQTWRFDKHLNSNSNSDYMATQQAIIDRHEPFVHILDAFLRKGDLVLEAGCGAGRWMKHLNQNGYRSVGVDISPDIVALIKRLDPELDVRVGNVLSLNFATGTFDAVLSSYVFEHFKDGPLRALREAHRVLKPGGILFFLVPYNSLLRRFFFNPLLDFACYCANRGRLVFVEYRFNRRQCRWFLRQSGFDVLDISPDEFVAGWNKGITVDYRNLQFYWHRLPKLPDDFTLPPLASAMTSAMSKLYPWSCCGGITCVARKGKSKGDLI
jgi:SAM-dependent methyltransferase